MTRFGLVVRTNLFGYRSFERQPLAKTRSLCFFYRKSMVGPPRPRFCCLQYHIILYVRSCFTTACCRKVVLLLHTTRPVLCCCQGHHEVVATTAATTPLCRTTVVVLAVFSYTKNQSRPTKKQFLLELSGIVPKQ